MYSSIFKKIERGGYRPNMPYPSNMEEYDDNHVFDESKSVKWNREMVAQKNKEREDAFAVYRKAENEGAASFKKDVIEYLKQEFGFNDAAAEKIYSKAYLSSHSEGYASILSKAQELGDLVNDIILLV